jgi:hypothetical protein
MFGFLFSVLVLAALLGIFGEIAMRIRLTRNEVSADKVAWWRRGGDDVASGYEKVFPDSWLPHVRRLNFWLLIVCAAATLFAILWRAR